AYSARLSVEMKRSPGDAAMDERREARTDVRAPEQRRAQQPVALDPRGSDDAHRVGVASARIAATIPASAPMSQKRIVTFTSGNSNWLCSGAMRKIRLPRSLKLPTWRITERVSATKITPATGRSST